MIINSNFRDYYDVIAKHGVDKTIIYNRFNKGNVLAFNKKEPYMYGVKLNDFPIKYLPCIHMSHLYIDTFLIFFCGKWYPVAYIQKIKNGRVIFHKMSYSFEETENFITNDKYLVRYYDRKSFLDFPGYITKNSLKRFFEYNGEGIDIQKYRVPIFTIERFILASSYFYSTRMCLNRRLMDFDFVTVKDPYSAYQEISQYISGVLGQNNDPTENISDEDMRDMKGFNNWSFKRESPGPKKERRRKKRRR